MSARHDPFRLDGALSGSSFVPRKLATPPVPEAPARKPGRPPLDQTTHDVTVRLTRRQTLFLDRAALQFRGDHDIPVTRSEILRSAIDLMENDQALLDSVLRTLIPAHGGER
jgi:hypothetical protein